MGVTAAAARFVIRAAKVFWKWVLPHEAGLRELIKSESESSSPVVVVVALDRILLISLIRKLAFAIYVFIILEWVG